MRILRIYHAGGEPRDRGRERELAAMGMHVTLVVPKDWPSPTLDARSDSDSIETVELPARRPGDVGRHVYVSKRQLREVMRRVRPDVVDIHEEPWSAAAHQWLAVIDGEVPVVMYTAQNIDKRLPPPYFGYERYACRRVAAFYPCSRQAAAVLRGKGYNGAIAVLPLGYDDAVFSPGSQSTVTREVQLAFVGRLIPEKGVRDALDVLDRVARVRGAKLTICGTGPEEAAARRHAEALGIAGRVEFGGWKADADTAATLRSAHVLLVPSYPGTVAEQFGRVIVEAQASGAVVAGYSCGAIPEVVGPAGIVVKPGDVDSLARAVLEVTADPVKFDRFRAAGLQQARVRTWRVVAQAHAELYRHAARRPARQPGLPRSPRARRAAAAIEFGDTAWSASGKRPFVLPLLRRGGVSARAVAAAIDTGAEGLARMRRFAGRSRGPS